MKRKEHAKRKMIQVIIYYFEKNLSIVNESKRLQEAVGMLKVYSNTINKLFPLMEARISGITKDKSRLRGEMVSLALKLSGLMEARSRDMKDGSMMKAVHCSLSDLRRPADDMFVKRCRLILKTATKQEKQLKAYGLTKAMLNGMHTMLAKFEHLMPKHKNEKGNKAAAHAEARKLLKEACMLLKHTIDPIMAALEVGSTKHDIYENMRMVSCIGRKRKAYGGRFKDKLTGKPLQNVQMTVVETAEKLVSEFADKVTVIIEKAGYKKIEIRNVDIMLLNEITGELEPEKNITGDSFTCFE